MQFPCPTVTSTNPQITFINILNTWISHNKNQANVVTNLQQTTRRQLPHSRNDDIAQTQRNAVNPVTRCAEYMVHRHLSLKQTIYESGNSA
jgi:hypothetical protein